MQKAAATYQRNVWKLVGITILVKLVLSVLLELGNDEVYYYTYALQPDWSHFDHPPMVGWLIRLSTLNLHWVSTLSMRLGAILCSALATFVIYETGSLLKNEKAGFIASLLYTFSIYTSIIAGMFIMPDSPQMLFYTLSIYFMVKWVK
jgi:4-amino-4-deoxy-L-arabinose transferase-like glycosyltransferase